MENNLKKIRKERGITQEQLAELADTSKGMISMLEKGERGMSQKWLSTLCPILNCDPLDILPALKGSGAKELQSHYERINKLNEAGLEKLNTLLAMLEENKDNLK